MMDITKPLTDYVIYNGRKLKLNISFDTVLKVYDIFKDGFLSDSEKAQFALALLVRGHKIPDLNVLDIIFREQ
ncbi:MAG: Gp15 family bacteriophage protein, partial [Porcipelethomonas sp.]